MPEVTLTINNRDYTVACDDGQEGRLRGLAAHIDERVSELTGSVGQVGESRLLVMAGLMIADELAEAYERIAELEAGLDSEAAPSTGPAVAGAAANDDAAAASLEACAGRLESLAARLERA